MDMMTKKKDFLFPIVLAAFLMPTLVVANGANKSTVLVADSFRHYIDNFNKHDEQLYANIPNERAWEFLRANIPLFECPDKDFEQTYYFRWWTYRKHVKKTPDGYVITEFLPKVPWSGKYNTISCAAGHHFYEGRWLHNPKYLNDYAVFWFRKGGNPRLYSFWAADAMYSRYLVNFDKEFLVDLLGDLVNNYKEWEKGFKWGRFHIGLEKNGLFFTIDDRDGGEMSIGGHGYRPTLNSYMYGDAVAIAKTANLAGQEETAKKFRIKAENIKKLVQTKLWDSQAKFFKVLPQDEREQLVDVREQHGYTPWYFNLPDMGNGYEIAWKQLMDPEGFYAPYGPTTAEQRHPKFALSYQGHECQWNGPSWPYATTVTLTAMANLLNNYKQDAVSKADYFKTLKIYTQCHHLRRDDGLVVPWIDENLNPFTGDWIARTRLKEWENGTWSTKKGGKERGKDYNHSTYCDLIITGLVGLRPRCDDIVEVNPLVPDGQWDWFCLDNVLYHGRILTILWDRTGTKYGKGKGLRIFANGSEIAQSDKLGLITGQLLPISLEKQTYRSESRAGWRKYEKNPVLGGKLGTCFDVAVLDDENTYRMYFSWRPKESIALVESSDGIHWSRPVIVLGPDLNSGWEGRVNRPTVIKRKNIYHMWYTGQSRDRSWIGYATSPDGLRWKRAGDKPVLSPEQPWEKMAVMCPHVVWCDEKGEFQMWYSGGEQYEPDAIGYATSRDGLHWEKWLSNPVFVKDPNNPWEQYKVTGCQVIRHEDWYLMFYIGFRDVHHAQIGIARSCDGLTNWQRHPGNPIISPGKETWDGDACYKPFVIYDKESDRWMLWYNGRLKDVEQIGLAIHEGKHLGF